MQANAIHVAELVFLALLFFVVLFAVLARKLQTPYPIVLVIAGLVLSFIPGAPHIQLNPDVVFLVVLPPLLYAAAWQTSWREFRFNMVSIFMLAFGLVGFTVAGVALVAPHVFQGFDWRLGAVLGAVVATTDAIAATSIAKRLGLPKRILDVLEGESLVNDASGLVALEFAVAALVSGRTASWSGGLLRLAYLVMVGLLVGLAVALVVEWFEQFVEDGPIEITVSIIVPYATYLAAEAMKASGVLAVVACGLYLSRKSSEFFSPAVRIQAWAFWDAFTFVLNGLVFVAIGLQLPYVLAEIHGLRFSELVEYGLAFTAILIVLRMLWMYPGAHAAYFIRNQILHQNVRMPAGKQIFVVGWTGMRGVVALAAAISLPLTLAGGQPFPQRNLIIFLTFCVILVTLVLQGLTLPPLIRVLGLAGAEAPDCEEAEARALMLKAAIDHMEKKRKLDSEDFASVYEEMLKLYQQRLEGAEQDCSAPDRSAVLLRRVELMRELASLERQTAIRLRNQGRISDELLRQLEYELDLTETKYSLASQRMKRA